MKNLVSVIVPVFNIEQYLERCLKSIVEQTYSNIEIILVDDGSTDNSGKICDYWKSKDCRIKVIHKANGGLSEARNYGMREATGEYVCFIDGDDWYDIGYVEVMLNALIETKSDVVECDYISVEGDEGIPRSKHDSSSDEVFEGRDCFYQFLKTRFFVSVCNKMYRKEIIGNELFRSGVLHEDEYWTYKVFSKVKCAVRITYVGYFYFQRQGSITNSKWNYRRIMDSFQAVKEQLDFIKLYYPEYVSVGYSRAMNTCMFLFKNVRKDSTEQRHFLEKELLSYFRTIFREYLLKGKYQKRIWRFCWFNVSPHSYCEIFLK